MHKIQANNSGTRTIDVSDLHLETIDKYALLKNLVDSNGLHQLVLLYIEWKTNANTSAATE